MENVELRKAENDLKKFLVQHPDMKGQQKEIERRMSKAPTFEAKMEILKFMISENLSRLAKETAKVGKIAESGKK